MDREVLLMGALGDNDGGFFGGTPIDAAYSVINNPVGTAQEVQTDGQALSQLSQASGTDPAKVLQLAQAATGSGTKTAPASSSTYAAPAASVGTPAAGGMLKAGVLAALVGGLYYVGKHKGWF